MYDPYGKATVLNGAADKDLGVSDWSADANNTSDWGWVYLHQGGRFDPDAGVYHFRNRDYSPTPPRSSDETGSGAEFPGESAGRRRCGEEKG